MPPADDAAHPEVEDGLAAMRTAVEGRLDGEELVSAQWFRPPGWNSSVSGMKRVLRRLGGSKDPQQRLRAMNLLVLTPTRVIAFTGETSRAGIAARDKVAEWPVGELTVGSKQHRVEGTMDSGSSSATSYSEKMVLISLRGGGGQPVLLECDCPKSPLTTHLVDHL